VKRTFAKPSREYSSGPLWVWNDRLTPEQIRSTIRDMASQQVKQVYVHPRPGLMTPYLSDEWFALWNVALDEAAKLDMNVWIYDENSYPSGFAGGFVPELMPESRGMGLSIKEAAEAPKWDNDLVAAHRVVGDGVEDVTAKVRDGGDAGSGPFLVSTIVRSGNSGWHGDRCYVNLITPGVTEKFLEVTLGAYDKHVAAQYGKRIPGVFTDEPNIRPAGGFPWCPDLPEQFRKQWGYDLVAALPGLVREVHRALGQAVLRGVREAWTRIHRALLGPRVAALRGCPGQHGDGGVAASAGRRHPDEPVCGAHPFAVWECAVLPGDLEHCEPAGTGPDLRGALRSGWLGPSV
jgi:hypothetical protein